MVEGRHDVVHAFVGRHHHRRHERRQPCATLSIMAEPDRRRLLADDEVSEALVALDQWQRSGDSLKRTFTFDDFTHAFAFMTAVALVSERLFHHPEWSNVWNRVDIAITNHDAGGITELDLEFCRRVDRLKGAHHD